MGSFPKEGKGYHGRLVEVVGGVVVISVSPLYFLDNVSGCSRCGAEAANGSLSRRKPDDGTAARVLRERRRGRRPAKALLLMMEEIGKTGSCSDL